MENFGLDLETQKYSIQNLHPSYIVFGTVCIFMLMFCTFINTKRRTAGQNHLRRKFSV